MRSRVWPARFADATGYCCRSRGYTIVEVVLVIVILAVLGTLAGPRFFSTTSFDERAYYDELAAAMRYAQKVAVASGCRVRVEVTASSFALSQQAAIGGHCDTADVSYPRAVRMSTGDPVTGMAPAGITTTPATTFTYDALGRTNLATNLAFTVGTRTFTVQADSGLVVTP